MPKLLTTLNKVGNFLIREQWRDRNWCRIEEEVNFAHAAGDTFEVGEIVGRAVAGTGAFGEVTVANHATLLEFGVLVDDRIQSPTFYDHYHADVVGSGTKSAQTAPDWDADLVTVAVLCSGDAMVRQDGMEYGELTTQGEKDVVNAVLEAQGIRVVGELTGKHYEVTPFTPYA